MKSKTNNNSKSLVINMEGKGDWGRQNSERHNAVDIGHDDMQCNVVYCDVTEQNRVAMSRHRHNVASRHYDGLRHCCYSGIN
jgi:hypothetical protein